MPTSTSKSAKGAAKTAPAKKASAKSAGAPKKFTRDGRWRLLAALSEGDLRRFEVGKKAGFPETTLHTNLTNAEKLKFIVKATDDTGERIYRITAAGRKALDGYLKKKSVAEAKAAKQTAGKPQATASETPKAAASKPEPASAPKQGPGRPRLTMISNRSSAELPRDLAAALGQILAPNSIERVSEKVALLEALEKKMPPAVAGRLREIASDLRRLG